MQSFNGTPASFLALSPKAKWYKTPFEDEASSLFHLDVLEYILVCFTLGHAQTSGLEKVIIPL